MVISLKDPFHEAKEAIRTAQREFTTINSLNVTTAYVVNHACELAVRAFWTLATETQFPYERFPHHKPERRGGPEEIAKTVLFLIETDFITGECIHVDGGRHLF